MGWPERRDLFNRTKKVIGQFEAILRGFSEDEQCADVLHHAKRPPRTGYLLTGNP